jgi:putative FmdB family regulatory protein
MPIYNYNCDECKIDFEILAKKSDEITACTSCGSKNIKRVYSSFDFNLKNSTPAACQTGGCPGGSCGI